MSTKYSRVCSGEMSCFTVSLTLGPQLTRVARMELRGMNDDNDVINQMGAVTPDESA